MVGHAMLKTWPSGFSDIKNLGLQPRFLSTWVPWAMFLTYHGQPWLKPITYHVGTLRLTYWAIKGTYKDNELWLLMNICE